MSRKEQDDSQSMSVPARTASEWRSISFYRERVPVSLTRPLSTGTGRNAIIALAALAGAATRKSSGGEGLGVGVGAGAVFLLVALFELLNHWLLSLRCIVRYARVNVKQESKQSSSIGVISREKLLNVTHVRVKPHAYSGKEELVPIERRSVTNTNIQRTSSNVKEETSFVWRKLRFVLSEEGIFERQLYPESEPFERYMQWTGLKATTSSSASASASLGKTTALIQNMHDAYQRWGSNLLSMPVPSFLALFKEQLLAPFFVFQLFCVALWCMDEYWYYSLFTLAMLLLFESTMSKTRQRTMEELRNLRPKPTLVNVFRRGKWEGVTSADLCPGDLISIGSIAMMKNVNTSAISNVSSSTNGGYDGANKGNSTANDDASTSLSYSSLAPADVLLLNGSCIVNEAMLTGESTPQWKSSIELREPSERLNMKADKLHVLFGGTEIMQHTTGNNVSTLKVCRPPDGGCVAVVIRTGFGTAQGDMMRTILFSTERVTANNWEAGLFILFLMLWAILAAGYVLHEGIKDGRRSSYKLFLSCVLIITSVIPPELPMELSIAVNTSLLSLARARIFCTEPFRIPFAGKVDVCCFDKTGTLTSDNMKLQGFAGLNSNLPASSGDRIGSDSILMSLIDNLDRVPNETVAVIAACQSLILLDDKVVGDPIEKAGLMASGYKMISNDVVRFNSNDNLASKEKERNGVSKEITHQASSGKKGNKVKISILQRHHFNSTLKRMSVVVQYESEDGDNKNECYMVLCKGAPEVILPRLSSKKDKSEGNFKVEQLKEAYKHFAAQGARVLAVAYKMLESYGQSSNVSDTQSTLRSLPREDVESDLLFGGFAVFGCPIKPQSAPALDLLRNSSHALVMITGDAPLTACHVAKELKMTTRKMVVLSATSATEENQTKTSDEESARLSSFGLSWVSPCEDVRIAYNVADITNIQNQYDCCISGEALARITDDGRNDSDSDITKKSGLSKLVKGTQVYARVSPEQKELIIKSLRDAGRHILMCGDGTNDVGGLKAAHIGVALLSASGNDSGKKVEAKKEVDPRRAELNKKLEELQKMRKQLAKRSGREVQDVKVPEWLTKMEEEMDTGEPQLVRPGDASLASPFTAKTTNIMPCVDIIRQGRCTLVTTLQTYKILGLNCLSTAYVLSVQYLDGVKLGDTQATISGMISAAFFLFISRSKPLKQLSAERPHTTIFSAYAFLSLLGQFAVHITFLISSVKLAEAYAPGARKPDPDTGFTPNLVNTVSYTTSMIIQIATFGVNYIGHPFNDALRDNTALYNSLWYAGAFFTLLSLDVVRPLNDSLQLVPLPEGFKWPLILMAICDISAVYTIEHGLRCLFPSAKGQQLFQHLS